MPPLLWWLIDLFYKSLSWDSGSFPLTLAGNIVTEDGGLTSSWIKPCFPDLQTDMIHSWNQLFFCHSSFCRDSDFLCLALSRSGYFYALTEAASFSAWSFHYTAFCFWRSHKAAVFFFWPVLCLFLSVCVFVLGDWSSSPQVHSSVHLLCGSCFCLRGKGGDEGSGQTPKG